MDVNPLVQFNNDLEKLASQTRGLAVAICTTAESLEKHSPSLSESESQWVRKTLSQAFTALDMYEAASQELQTAIARLKYQMAQRGDGNA